MNLQYALSPLPGIRACFAAALIVACATTRVIAAEFSVSLSDSKGEPVSDVVISLIPLDAPLPPLQAPLPVTQVVQQDGEFSPYVTAVQRGTRVDFPNKDQVQHHVYSLSPAKRFETPLHGGDTTYGEVLDKAGVVTVGCNIHDWMLAYIVVLDTPWFAISHEQGKAGLGALPVGRYRLEIWHPRLVKPLTEELIVNEGGTSRIIQLALKPDRRIRRSLEGKAAGYR
jgi:hypothetical protein